MVLRRVLSLCAFAAICRYVIATLDTFLFPMNFDMRPWVWDYCIYFLFLYRMFCFRLSICVGFFPCRAQWLVFLRVSVCTCNQFKWFTQNRFISFITTIFTLPSHSHSSQEQRASILRLKHFIDSSISVIPLLSAFPILFFILHFHWLLYFASSKGRSLYFRQNPS